MFFKFKHFPYVRAIHVLKDDELVFKLANKCTADTLFPVGCVFKSFLSALVGIAIHDGKIHSIHDKIIDYYPEHPVSTAWESVTIEHALTCRSGLHWKAQNEPLPQTMSEVFSLSFDDTPGTVFAYKPDAQILVYLLEDLYQLSIVELFDQKLAKYYPELTYSWNRDDIENLQVPIQFLDELGKIYLNKGMIGENVLFDETFYQASVRAYSDGGFPEELPYGLGWWITSYSGCTCFLAAGFGGQILAVIPGKKMIISILCDMNQPHPEAKKLVELAIHAWF